MDLERRLQELVTLNAIGEILNVEADFASALAPALERLVGLVGLSSGWVFLTRTLQGDSHQGGFKLAAATGLSPAIARDGAAPLLQGSCECQGLLQRGKLDHGVNIVYCSRLEGATGDKGGLEVHASVPLLGQNGPVGILNLAAPGDTRFDAETLAFLTAVGRQLGTAFDRSRLQEERSREARYLAVLEERQRLANDMHDSLTQLLFAAGLSLQVARGGDEGALAKTAELIDAALAELRAVVEVLRPADLSGGLRAALARLAQRTTGAVTVHLEADALSIGERQAEALYRIAQEALHNALRHAQAATVWLKLEGQDGQVVLSVQDDGRGLPSEVQEGLGMTSMAARARALGGTFNITGTRGGTRVEVTLPC